jgi:hypothetical protein
MRSEAGDIVNEFGRGALRCVFEISWSCLTELPCSDVLDAMHGSLPRGM